VFDILKHPIQRFAFDRVEDLKVIASNKPTVAVQGCGVRILFRGLQEHFEKLWRCGVVMLSVTEKFLQILLQKPVEVPDPVQTVGMNDHAESRIDQEGTAGGSRFRIVTVNGDEGLEIAEGLSLQAMKSVGDEIGTLIDRQSHSNARCRHIYVVHVSRRD
jgi:hypothetical protein